MTTDHIVIVGTGFAGLAMGIRLKQAGIHDFTILEQAGAIGGTWRDNRYPGAACDVESHLYSFSFEPNPGWSRAFAPQREILDYLDRCADKYGLRPHIRFHTPVAGATFDEASGQWRVRTGDGGTIDARVVVSGVGGLSRPANPDIPGLGDFEGSVFHTARWNHERPLDGKRVAVIGTGASAIQVVPAIAPRVGRLDVFQRTPPWILPKPDRDIPVAERERFRLSPLRQRLARLGQYWRHELMAFGFVVEPRILQLASRLALRYLAARVPDVALRARMTPDYTLGCKRVLLSNDYYDAFRHDHVHLVTDGIREVVARGIVTRDGLLHPADAIVLATGFQTQEAMAPFAVTGRDGRDLNDAWRGGAEAFLGTTVAGFPNLFLIVGPNTGLGHSSMVLMIESQAQYILDAVRTMRARRWKLVDVRAASQARYNRRLHARLAGTVWSSGCASWYQTRDGKNTTLWPGFTFEYRLRTRRFRPADYEVVPESAPATRPAAQRG